jgi:hypothetical protein
MRYLNIGSGPAIIPVLPWFEGWDAVRLDLEPSNEPDLLMDAMDLDTLDAAQFDAAYASHILEHIYPFDLARFLNGVRHVLTDDGILVARVPDILLACRIVARQGDLNAFIYDSPAGPVTAWDMLYGYRPYQMQFGRPMAHHDGYSASSLSDTLRAGEFETVYTQAVGGEIIAIACKTDLTAEMKKELGIDKRSVVHSDAGRADVGDVRLVREVAELPLSGTPGYRGNGDTPAARPAGGRGADVPGNTGHERRLRLPVVHRSGRLIPTDDA